MSPRSVALAYAGVHEIFQLGLAAHEAGGLDSLHCSAVDLPGKWGRLLSGFVSAPSLRPLGYDALPAQDVREFPWPLLVHRVIQKLLPRRKTVHLHMNDWFDRVIARRLRRSSARLFVGAETCSLHSLRAARAKGMKTLLDCPGIPSPFLEAMETRAASERGLAVMPAPNTSAMLERKLAELKLADRILACSELQKRALVGMGAEAERITVVPLWVDAAFWAAGPARATRKSGPLRVLYAGAVSLRKGVPYLLDAMKELQGRATLTLVGAVPAEARETFFKVSPHTHHEYVPKQELRRLFSEHDVLVMPSLGDSFGFVVIEAMAAGLPVIVSVHCGVPVPDESWRVPAFDAAAITRRLEAYLSHPEWLQEHGEQARVFAQDLTPARYRQNVANVMRELLSEPSA
jgi:glycosyltransferase involved in cell wall biosynthesis